MEDNSSLIKNRCIINKELDLSTKEKNWELIKTVNLDVFIILDFL